MIVLDESQVIQIELLKSLDRNIQLSAELELIEKLKPSFQKDGNQYCYLYGENLQEGIAGFGSTVSEAVSDFYRAFNSDKA